MFAALRIMVTDPRWFARVYRFYRDQPWSEPDGPPGGPWRAFKKVMFGHG